MRKFYRLNYNIIAPKLRVLDYQGKQVGIFDRNEAINKAKELSLDLVEIAPRADPPVAKLINFKKFLYEEAKKERQSVKNASKSETKEIWLGPLMSDHDLGIKLKQAREFLEGNNRVKFTVKFTVRQMAHTELGFKLVDKVKENLKEEAIINSEPKMLGRRLIVLFNQVKGKNNNGKNENKQNRPEAV